MIDPRNNERAGVSPRDEGVSAGPTSTDTDSLSESSALDREVQQAMEGMDPQDLADLSGDVQMPSQAGVTPSSSLNRGLEMTARVVAIDGDDVFLDYGGKSQAVLPRTQLEDPENVKPGQILDVTVDRFEGDSGLLLVNRKGAIRKAEWDSLEVGMVVQGRVTGMIKGGLELSVNNLRAFMPASHASLVPLKDVSVLLNENLQAIVIEVDAKAKNFVVSHRKYLQKEQKENRKKLMTELDVGQTRDGTVNNITEFGAFVDLGGVDGLIHISDLSWTNVDKVTDVVNIGDKVQVQVQKIENNGKRISLSLKHTQPDPWMGVANRFPEGASVKARVVRLTNFGAFAELEPGVEALIPVSEMGWSRVQKPSDAVKKDETVDAVVIRVEPERRRIALSMKQAQKDPWEGVLESFEPNSLVTGKVTRIADFGAFVEVTTGVEGLIHISELSDQRVRTVSDVVKVGQEVETRVLGVDADSRRISLSIKAVKNPPSEEIALEAAEPAKPRKRKKALRGGLSSHFEW